MSKVNSNLKWVFFGTPKCAVTILSALKKHALVPNLVVTKPDAPQGRGQKVMESDVKRWAKTEGVLSLEPEKLDREFKERLLREGWDLFVVVAYGKVLPKWLLDIPRYGCLNIHFSLLPLYRGATPTETQILEGATKTGVTIILIDEELDHGPIITQEAIPMPSPLPTNEKLVGLLSSVGGKLLAQTIPEWIAGNIDAQEQEHEHATYTRKFDKSEAEIKLADNPVENFRKIRAFSSWPRTYFFAKGKRFIITQAHLEKDGLVIDRVIPEGKKETNWENVKMNL